MKKNEKIDDLTGDYLGLDETESCKLPHDPMTEYIVRQCLASNNKGVQACLLYNAGYRLLISGERSSSLQILKILEKLDKNLSALLSSKHKKYSPSLKETNTKLP